MRNFGGAPVNNYLGVPFAIPVQLLSGPKNIVAPINIIWSLYGAATAVPLVGVNVDLSIKNVAVQLGSIRSVYIDNTASNVSVYIRASDTQYTVVCEPNSEGWFPWFSALSQMTVYGLGFTDGSIPTTNIIFSNLPVIPSLNPEIASAVPLWLASASISRGTGIQNQNYGVPALGDQVINFNDSLGAAATGVLHDNLWGTPFASGFIYLTHILVQQEFKGAFGILSWTIQSTGAAGVLFSYTGAFAANLYTFEDLSGANIKLDATQKWQINVSLNGFGANSCVLRHTFVWTQNPQ